MEGKKGRTAGDFPINLGGDCMKKLIAISVMFALIAGAAFAVDLGGAVIVSTGLAGASGGGDPEVFSSPTSGGIRARIEGSGEGDIGIGTVGGWIRFDAAGDGTDIMGGYAAALVWYQPIDALRIQLGNNPDGHYDVSHIGRFGFYAMANKIDGLVTPDGNWGPYSFDWGVFGGYNAQHFALIITPMDALTINVAIPFNQGIFGTNTQIASALKNSLFQVNYSAGFGAIHVTYQGNDLTNNEAPPNTAYTGVTGRIYGSVFLSMIENVGIELGVGYQLVESGALKPPVGISLGATYNAGAFGVKLRAIVAVPMESGGDLGFRVDLLPYFAVNDNATAYVDVGILMANSDNLIWHFAPYIRIGAEWGTAFYVGFRAANAGAYSIAKNASGVNWSIPIGIIANF
jgi:opacity protein-like surface antigen